jgi:hypothetical protein
VFSAWTTVPYIILTPRPTIILNTTPTTQIFDFPEYSDGSVPEHQHMIHWIDSHNSHHKERRFDPPDAIKSAGELPLSNTEAHFSSFHNLWI